MAFSPDGRLLALAVLDGKLLLWDVVARRTVATLIAKAVGSVAFSPDGCWLAAGRGDGKLELWDVAARQAVAALGEGEPGGVWGVAFSPDGRWLASGKGYTVKLWDMETQRGVATLTEHTWPIISVAFSPDGRWLASGSLDGTIKLWDVKAWQEAVTLVGHTEAVNSVAFSSDSRWLASASIDADNPGAHGLKLWELPPAVPSHAGSDRPPQEEVKWWREAGYCEVCGRPLGFLGKLLRRVQCRRCR